MEIGTASRGLAALGHETRLAIFRLLVQAGPEGLNAGAICEKVGIPSATLSFHLAHLTRVGLISRRQEGRFIYYAADYTAMNELLGYLTENCCQGKQCLPAAACRSGTKRRSNASSR